LIAHDGALDRLPFSGLVMKPPAHEPNARPIIAISLGSRAPLA
jgi:hypothetical protein